MVFEPFFRLRRKNRVRGRSDKEIETSRPDYASLRYPRRYRDENYFDFDDPQSEKIDSRVPENVIERNYHTIKKEYTPRSEGRNMNDSLRLNSAEYELEPEHHRELSKKITSNFSNFDEMKTVHATSKLNFEEEQGFESDFNSPPPSNSGKIFRFSNDFSEKETSSRQLKQQPIKSNSSFSNTPNSAKLRFDENVTISKFDSSPAQMFEDDFSKAEFSFENEDKWNSELPKKNLKQPKSYENIKKSESVNIFAKKTIDPFEDDDFFKTNEENESDGVGSKPDPFQWNKNFAKFDENI